MRISLALAMILCAESFVVGQVVDTDFNQALIKQAAAVRKLVKQSDGKILVAGEFEFVDGELRSDLFRLNEDLSLDNSFDFGVLEGFLGDFDNDGITLQDDDKVLIYGVFTSLDGVALNNLARLNTDGSLDETFDIGLGPNGFVRSVEVQSDGKIVVVGAFSNWGHVERFGIVRLNSDGSLDETFNTGEEFDNQILAMEIQSDDKLLVGGVFRFLGDLSVPPVIRFNGDGSLDDSFNMEIIEDVFFMISIEQQADNKILVGGFFNQGGNSAITRLNADGSTDNTFDVSALPYSGNLNSANDIEVLGDGRILVGGAFANGEDFQNMLLLNTDGSEDENFSFESSLQAGVSSTLAVGTNHFMAGGSQGLLLSFDQEGLIDENFNLKLQKSASLIVKEQTNGKLLLAGNLNQYGDTEFQHTGNVIRIDSDGTLDDSFQTGTVQGVNSLAIQEDGKILVGGGFVTFNGSPLEDIVRLNEDGSIDQTFNPGTGVEDGFIREVRAQADGKILVGGSFGGYNGTSVNGMIRLNADGTLDESFTTSFDFISVSDFRIAEDGKIVAGGDFLTGSNFQFIVRLNSDGTLDESFDIGSAPDMSIGRIALDKGGRVVAFAISNGQPGNRLFRFNSDGSMDDSFQLGDGFSNQSAQATDMIIQNDGKIIVGGIFRDFDGNEVRNIVRINSDGSYDDSFQLDFADLGIHSISILSDGNLMLTSLEGFGMINEQLISGAAKYLLTKVSNISKNAAEDSKIDFNSNDFMSAFQDEDEDPLEIVKILSFQNGELTLNDEPIQIDQELSVSNLDGLVFNPDVNFNGQTIVEYNASDGESFALASAHIVLDFSPVNDAPTIDDIPDQATSPGAAVEISITVNDVDSGSEELILSFNSDDQNVVSQSGATFEGVGNSRTLTIVPNDMMGSTVITVTVSDGQFESSSQFTVAVSSVTGVYDDQFIENLSIFPNPSSDEVSFHLQSNYEGIVHISLYGVTGELVKRFDQLKQTESMEWGVDLRDLPRGIYHIRLNMGEDQYSKRLILR